MSSQPNNTINPLPELYQLHPSRPITYKPSPGPRRGVIVVFPTPLTPSDERKMQELQGLRKGWDQAWGRWLPHITLVAPFSISATQLAMDDTRPVEEAVDPSHFEPEDSGSLQSDNLSAEGTTETEKQLHALLVDACASFKSHTINLSGINTFSLRSYTNIHLRPDDGAGSGYGELIGLQGACEGSVKSFLGGDGKPQNRAERRREQHATKASQTSPPASAVHSQQMHQGPPPDTESSARTYTRPMYREAEDEARCITLPTTEITIDPIPNDDSVHRQLETTTGSQDTATPSIAEPRRLSDPNHPGRRSQARGNNRAFTPHLSIGQARTPSSRDRLISLVRRTIDEDPVKQEPTGINCRIDTVWFLSKPVGAAGPYEVVSSIPLGSEDVGQ